MINNEMKKVKVLSYVESVDIFGQLRKTTPTERTIEMYVKIFSQTNVNDPRYNNVEMIGLTKSEVYDGEQIEIDGKVYDILRITPSKRFCEVLLRAVHQ